MPDTTTEKSLPTLLAELWELVRGYALQQTLDPMKGIGRYAAFGLAGSFALGIGVVLLLLALLRALQTETDTALTGNWSWVPYVVTLLVGAIVIGLAAWKMSPRKDRRP